MVVIISFGWFAEFEFKSSKVFLSNKSILHPQVMVLKTSRKKTKTTKMKILVESNLKKMDGWVDGLYLRTVPTNYKGFCARLRPCRKSRSLQLLLESTRKNGGSHAFFRDN